MHRLSPLRAFLFSALVSIAYKALGHVLYRHGLDKISAKLAMPTSDSHTSADAKNIPIDGSVPYMPAELQHMLQEAMERVTDAAQGLVEEWLSPRLSRQMRGVPGTVITTQQEAWHLQTYLDCVASQGSWQRDEEGSALRDSSGGVTVHKHSSSFAACDKRFYKNHRADSVEGWDVRDDLKWKWQTSQMCDSMLPSELLETWRATPEQIADLPSRRSLCQLLRHKNMLLVGDAATHYLVHDLLLDWTSDKPLTCYGDLFCNEHGICGGSLAEGASGDDGWERDTTPNDRLPMPPTRNQKSKLLLRTNYQQPRAVNQPPYGTVLRYRRSDGLYLRTSPSMPGHDARFQHPATNVREINNYALSDARRSDLVLLYKAPLPLPTHDAFYGNWSSAIERAEGRQKIEIALQMVIAMTLDTWLPDLLDSLVQLRDAPSPAESLVIYRSGWRHARDCAIAGDPAAPSREAPRTVQQFLESMDGEAHIIVHDLQTIVQNHLLRRAVLPRFGIPFLDLETPLAIWRTGFVSGGETRNCIQYCLPSPGMALERALLGGLWKVLAWGWARDEATISQWTGKDYTPVRIRHPHHKAR